MPETLQEQPRGGLMDGSHRGAGGPAPRLPDAHSEVGPGSPLAELGASDVAASPRATGLSVTTLTLLGSSAIFKVLLAALVTQFVLVDDAYIHLRYARNLSSTGQLVYNPGEAVFGLTSPLYGLLTGLLYWLTGPLVEQAVVLSNIGLWTLAGAALARRLPRAARFPVLSLFLFWPSFVDNQLLGMETPLFVLLLLLATGAALDGRIGRSALAYGLALITRPEAVLLAPCLLVGGFAGRRQQLRQLLRPAVLAALVGPGLAWCAFALTRYGTVIPQSMLAKTGWNSEHYDTLFTLKSTLLAVPRLTFLPFVDYFPGPLLWTATAVTIGLALAVLATNVHAGTRESRTWAGFYALYMGFFLAGKGATEASWYSVPSSVALLLAAQPLLTSRRLESLLFGRPGSSRPRRLHLILPAGLALLGAGMAFRRAPLLQSYVDGYGRSAEHLNVAQPRRARVLIGEIGVYGFLSRHDITDVGALVSPEVLPMKNAGFSLCRMIREAGADYFVVSEHALEHNRYPSVGVVWADERERAWLESCELVAEYAGKRTFRVPRGPAAR